jgi:hypothetical protein
MKLDITIDTDAIRTLALNTAREKAESATREQLAKHFARGSYWQQPKGAGYLAIEQQIDELICGDEITKQTKRIIDEKFAAILEREIEYQLTRRAKKLAAAEIKARGL